MNTTTDLEKPRTQSIVPVWQRGVMWASVLAAGFTALCCLGLSAALSLASAVGATFLTRDSTLRPILAITLVLTVAGSALTFWRHRRPGPLIVTAVAAVSVYGTLFLAGGSPGAHGGSSEHMTDQLAGHMADHAGGHAGFTGGRLTLVWVGLALLVAAQAWDLVRVRVRA
jgi:MerC mercury resistance protein